MKINQVESPFIKIFNVNILPFLAIFKEKMIFYANVCVCERPKMER